MSARFIRFNRKKSFQPPGTLISSSQAISPTVHLTIIDYDQNFYQEKESATLEQCVHAAKEKNLITWVQIQGLADSKLIEEIGRSFGIQSLWLEDVLNTDHRPKAEELDDILFVIIKSLISKDKILPLNFEQVSLFLGENFVVTFEEIQSALFHPIKERIRTSKGRVRSSGADYLFYALVDTVVDNYYATLEALGREIESLETLLDRKLEPHIPQKILRLRGEILYVNRALFPIRETLAHVLKTVRADLTPETRAFLKDTYDHTMYLVDVVENYRNLLTSIMEAYQSALNIKTNEIIKFLTMFSTFFIPLTFIVGVYGMNFEFMPELHWHFGYEMIWVIMAVVSGGMAWYFKRKGWFD